MAKFIESIVGVSAILMLCQDGFSIHVPKMCFRLCKEHLNGFPMQTRQIIDANAEFVKRVCDCDRFHSRRRRSVDSSKTTPSSSIMSKSNLHTTTKPTSKDGSKYCNYKKPDVLQRKMNDSEVRAQNVDAFFYKNDTWWANITWSPPEGTSFTEYLIFWDGGDIDENASERVPRCRTVSKNTTFQLFGQADGWKYPNNITVLVVILPGYNYQELEMDYNTFRPPIPPTIEPTKDSSKYCNNNEIPIDKKRKMNDSEVLAQNVDVVFYKNDTWWANVTWSPPEGISFTEYLIRWDPNYRKDEETGMIISRCRVLSKNTTFIIFGQADGWEYADPLEVLVVVLPAYNFQQLAVDYLYFSPPVPPGTPVTLEPPREMQHGAIIAGVLAGILFIVVLLVLLYKRKTCGASQPQHHIIIPMQDNNNADAPAKVNNTSKPQNVDTYFASYLPESEKYSTDVATIAYKLGVMGYRVVFDKVDSVRMNEVGFNMWVDKQILEAKKYIVFCSPGYVRLWQSLASSTSSENKFNHVSDQDLVRVRYEIKRISDVYSENCSTSRIVCIKMDNKMSTKLLPPWMNHNMLLWPEEKEDIIRRINDQAAMVMLNI